MCMYIRVTNQMHGEELLHWTGCSELLTDVSVTELTCTVTTQFDETFHR